MSDSAARTPSGIGGGRRASRRIFPRPSTRLAMALASMKAISPEIYSTMMAGLSRGRRVTLGGLRACLKAAAR